MLCTTINEVITTLDSIIEECKNTNNPSGYFAILYRKVTQKVKEGIHNQEFEDNPRMEKLDVLFANRFIEAYYNSKQNNAISKSWRVAIEASNSSKYIVLQHLLLGINAHINLDLGIATVQTIEEDSLENIKKDFYTINQILSNLTEEAKQNMGAVSPVFRWLMPLAKNWEDKIIQFSITTARDGAWEFAKQLEANQENYTNLISERDISIAKLGYALIHPVNSLQWILNTIRFWEYKSVAEKMTIMETKL